MAHAFSVAIVIRLLIPSLLFIPACLMLVSVVPGSRTGPVLLSLGAMVGFVRMRLTGRRQMAVATVARFSSQGVEMEDVYGSRTRLQWRNVERIDVVETRIPSPRTVTDAGRVVVRTGARRCVGLVGWGEYEIPRNASGWLLAHRDRLPVDPATGLREIGIPLGVVDPLWEHGPMGERVRRRILRRESQ
ncbi:hypothetical protein [Planobispora takensis]|uniref:Uncharacterized protein n=1 Tax=Planobispora takensis TaxID=1367882 RepID=A0A8J3T0W0_9ACTN|nr:hypothetical protein [Planobispora takensis]GII03012.1 hypothetical protein Pta02_50200 [Planobispora takensis]